MGKPYAPAHEEHEGLPFLGRPKPFPELPGTTQGAGPIPGGSELIEQAINNLPPQCRSVFIKSRMENKNVNEIAEELQLSPRTVEKHIEVALKKLRNELKDHLLSLTLLEIFIRNLPK